MTTVTELPAWLTLQDLARELGCSARSLRYDLAKFRDSRDPMPSAMIYGRRKFRLNEVEAWLERHGRMRKEGAA